MSKLLSYYQLCPVTDEIIGVSQDCDENSIIITLGKKIVYIMQVMSILIKLNQLFSINRFSCSWIIKNNWKVGIQQSMSFQVELCTILLQTDMSEFCRKFIWNSGMKTRWTSTVSRRSKCTNRYMKSWMSQSMDRREFSSFTKMELVNRWNQHWNRKVKENWRMKKLKNPSQKFNSLKESWVTWNKIKSSISAQLMIQIWNPQHSTLSHLIDQDQKWN